jgi:hypothetical protein
LSAAVFSSVRGSWAGLVEVLRVCRQLPVVEGNRRRIGLHGAVARSRRLGALNPVRPERDRRRLQRAISLVDRCLPGGGNCVRRALLEMALDGGAAGETFHAGLRSEGGPRSGHAWLASHETRERYDAVISI